MLRCSQSWKIADVYLVLLHCWAGPSFIRLLSHILSFYLAELFPISKYCWCVPCIITLLKSSQSWNIAEVLPVSWHCRAVPNFKTLLTYTLCYYMAELYPISVHCRTIPIHCCRFSRNVVGSQSESGNTSPKSPESCRLGCRFLCFVIGSSDSTRYNVSQNIGTCTLVDSSRGLWVT